MKKILWLFFSILMLFLATVLWNQEQIMHPKKRELQNYHYDWLEHPFQHGMKIQKLYSQNKSPYLIVSLPEHHVPSKRQLLLQKQLNGEKMPSHKGILLLLHGKNGRKEDLLPVAERYISLGFTCIIPDLPRHGESKIETLYYATTAQEQHYVDEVLDDASKYVNISNELYIWGISLGGAFSIQSVAHSKYHFKRMVLVATFERLDKVLQEKSCSLFASLFGNALYNTLEKSLNFFYNFKPSNSNSAKVAQKLTLPLYQVHGEQDELISPKQGQELFKNFASKEKSFFLDREGNHHNILVTKHRFYLESGLFLLK